MMDHSRNGAFGADQIVRIDFESGCSRFGLKVDHEPTTGGVVTIGDRAVRPKNQLN